MKKFISLFLIFSLLIFSFCACSGKSEDDELSVTGEQTVNTGNLKLAYSKNDSLNPYQCTTTINSQITGLVFDGLVKVNSTYEAENVIAKSVIVSGRAINVTINDVLFSDGSSLKVSDIIYSFNLAKESDTYSSRLSNCTQITTSSENMLMIILENADPYAASCLDFPIIKEGSDEEMPVGSGRYSYEKDGEDTYLVVNTNKSSFNPAIKTISLEAVHDSDSAESSVVIGNTALYYNDLSDGTYTRINAQSVEMGINSFIYLGLNPDCSYFQDENLRKAVSLCIDRSTLVTNAFRSHARAATLPFNPDWYATESYNQELTDDMETASSLLEDSGVDPKSEELTILYNRDNEFKTDAALYIEECLENLGFIVRKYGVGAEEFENEIKNNDYDLYIGEVKLDYDMNLSPLFTGNASYGYASSSQSASEYSEFLSGNCELMDFINVFNNEMPLIPLCYRNASVSYTNSLTADKNPCDGDIFYDIESWSIK